MSRSRTVASATAKTTTTAPTEVWGACARPPLRPFATTAVANASGYNPTSDLPAVRFRRTPQRIDDLEREHGDEAHQDQAHSAQHGVRRQAEGLAGFDREAVHEELHETPDGAKAALVEVAAGEAPSPPCRLEGVSAGGAGVEVDAEPVC